MLQDYLYVVTHRISNFTIGISFALIAVQFLVHRHLKIKQSFIKTLNNYLSNVVYIIFLDYFLKSPQLPNLEFNFHTSLRFFFQYKVITFTAVLFIQDFVFYWVHRLYHSHPVFWAFHEGHHSSEDLNFSTALRNPWVSVAINKLAMWPLNVLFLILGVPADVLIWAESLRTLHPFFVHCGYMIQNKYISWIFITPHDHANHHSSLHAVSFGNHGKNYGRVFSIYDHVFKTYEKNQCTQIYGCKNLDYDPTNFFKFQLYPFRRLLRSIANISGVKNKINFLIFGKIDTSEELKTAMRKAA